TDPCGNTAVCTRIVEYQLDTTAPVITSCPPDLFLGCATDSGFVVPEPDLTLVEFSDNCEATVEVRSDGISLIDCVVTLNRLYTVTDRCGNTATCYQVIQWLEDTQAPIITECPK